LRDWIVFYNLCLILAEFPHGTQGAANISRTL
jgi:hypothetical protein